MEGREGGREEETKKKGDILKEEREEGRKGKTGRREKKRGG